MKIFSYLRIVSNMLLLLITTTLICQPNTEFRFDSDGALSYSIHGGYRKLPRVGFTRCNCS